MNPEPQTPPERVLIVRMSHLGDIAQALPLVHGIRSAWPNAEIAWAIQPAFAGLVAPLAHVIPFARGGGAAAWPTIRRALREFNPDLALDAQGNWKSAFATRFSGARRRIGFAREHWQEPMAAKLLSVASAPFAASDHLIDRAIGLCQAVTGVAPTRRDPCLTGEERARGRSLLGAEGPTIILHPGVPGDPRTWPEARFQDLAERLIAEGRNPLILTGPGEAATGERLRNALPRARHIVGQRGLRDFAALLACAADDGGALVVGDSGPAHVAASVDLPVWLLAGPEDPARTGPWPITSASGSRHRLLDPPAASPLWTPRAIESITVDAVLRELLER